MRVLPEHHPRGRLTPRALLTIWAMLVALWAPGAATAQGARLPAPGRLLFSQYESGARRSHIYVQRPGYDAPRRVHSHRGLTFHPKWSPDASMIAFDGRGIFVMDADGSHVEQVVEVEGWRRPCFTWAPGDRQLTYYKPKALDAGDLWTLDVDNPGVQEVVTRGHEVYSSAAWSPDRTRLAYTTGNGAGSLYVMDADGRNVTPVRGGASAKDPAWSPDGKRLAFRSSQGMKSNIFVAELGAGGFARQVTDGPYWKETPAWVAGGEWIAYAFSGDVHVVSPEGGRSQPLGVQHGEVLINYFDWFDPSLEVSGGGKLPSVWGALKAPVTP
jgi:Tol biopolymer transport system component